MATSGRTKEPPATLGGWRVVVSAGWGPAQAIRESGLTMAAHRGKRSRIDRVVLATDAVIFLGGGTYILLIFLR